MGVQQAGTDIDNRRLGQITEHLECPAKGRSWESAEQTSRHRAQHGWVGVTGAQEMHWAPAYGCF